MNEPLKLQDFTELADGALPVTVGDQVVPLKVVEARALQSPSPRQEPVIVVLRGPRDPMLLQGTHAFTHPRRGRIEVFIVPVARDAAHSTYEAVFN